MFDFKNSSPEALKNEYKRIAKEIGDDQFFTRKELKHLPSVLADGEQVISFVSGLYDGSTQLIALTDRRIIILDKGMIYGLKQAIIDLDKVNAVSCQTGIIFGKIIVEDGASRYVVDNVLKKTVIAFTNKIRDAVDSRKQSNSGFVSGGASSINGFDVVSALEKLASLRERGILTDDEFLKQKAAILGQ